MEARPKIRIGRDDLHPDPAQALQQVLMIKRAKVRGTQLDRYRPHKQQLRFHMLGRTHQIRFFFGGNRTGKTVSGASEVSYHLLGEYPDWWPGKRFTTAIRCWVASETAEVVRDVSQLSLMGPPTAMGSGMIPKERLGRITYKRGTVDSIDSVLVLHKSGRWSRLQFKCHPGRSLVLMADGSWRRIDHVKLFDEIRSPDGSAREVTQLYAYRNAPLIRLHTRSGSLDLTPNHPVFTARGKIDAGDVVIGDELEISYCEPDSRDEVEDWRVAILALMIGDGCTRGKTPFFTCNEPLIVEEVKALLPPDLYVVPLNGTISYKISSRLWRQNRLTDMLRENGLWNVKSKNKWIPAWIFGLPRHKRILFLRWLWSCDGSITEKNARYSSSSERLINDVRLLLWSVGIHAPYKRHFVGNGSGKRFEAFYIDLNGENRISFSGIGKIGKHVANDLIPRPKGPPGGITEIEILSPEDVYCVGVEGLHELIVDGYRVGNSYDQGRRKFQGTSRHVVWCDEEPPKDVFDEIRMRTMDVEGHILLTMTPLQGMSDVCMLTFGEPADTECAHVLASWEDNPYLSKIQIGKLEKNLLPHEREARQHGRPTVGAGKIYPFPRSIIEVDDFEIPGHWPRGAGMDFGFASPTAAVWGAHDLESDILYLYSEHYLAETPVYGHCGSVLARGSWIPIWGDPQGLTKGVKDGESLFDVYAANGVMIFPAEEHWAETTATGINAVYERIQSGRIKVFKSLKFWYREFDLYHRDEKGEIYKKHDHLMDATRFLVRNVLGCMVRPYSGVNSSSPILRQSHDTEFGGF